MMRNSDYRPDRSLLRAWTSNSGEAIKWYRDILHESGVQDDSDSYSTFELDCNGYTASFISAIPETTFVNAISNVAEYATSHGVDLHYSMPGVQLVVEDGNVTGVVAPAKRASTCASTPPKAWCWPRATTSATTR